MITLELKRGKSLVEELTIRLSIDALCLGEELTGTLRVKSEEDFDAEEMHVSLTHQIREQGIPSNGV